MRQGKPRSSDEGVVQGSACSPVLANIFAHQLIDQWFEGPVKPRCFGMGMTWPSVVLMRAMGITSAKL